MKLIVDLTNEEASTLGEAMLYYEDSGPAGEGWQSVAMASVHAKIAAAINKARKKAGNAKVS